MPDINPKYEFSQEANCIHKDEKYSVRNNGAVLRHLRVGKRRRPNDNQWTLGNPNDNTGYIDISSIPVHRIIATAFHGMQPSKQHVVDHIDTNKRNNRPENLRWVTRLENVLLNPITAKRIARICGSVEAFLADPSKFRDMFQEPNFSWMRAVSIEEAQISVERMLAWAKNDKLPAGGTLDEWIFNRASLREQQTKTTREAPAIIISKTSNAVQRNWRTLSEFPCCPQEYTEEPIKTYAENLKVGSVFCQNVYYSALVSKCTISDDQQNIYVISESVNTKPWALAKINYENSLFVHTSLGSFFTHEGVEKDYCLAQGLVWTGGDTFDDLV